MYENTRSVARQLLPKSMTCAADKQQRCRLHGQAAQPAMAYAHLDGHAARLAEQNVFRLQVTVHNVQPAMHTQHESVSV